MDDICIVWDLNGVLFKNFKLDINTFKFVECFNKLGLDQYVCTNTFLPGLIHYKSKYQLERYFKKIYSTCEMGIGKENPKTFLFLKEDIKKKYLFVDDQKCNISACVSVGIKSILYLNDDQLRNDFKLLGLKI